jgi:hypothetical protein
MDNKSEAHKIEAEKQHTERYKALLKEEQDRGITPNQYYQLF